MDGWCKRCEITEISIRGDFCPHCGTRMWTQPPAGIPSTAAAQAAGDAMDTDREPLANAEKKEIKSVLDTAHGITIIPAANTNTQMQDTSSALEPDPTRRRRDSRSRSPARDRDPDGDLEGCDTANYRQRTYTHAIAQPKSTVHPQRSPSFWCLWCHCTGHFGHEYCITTETRPTVTVTTLSDHWIDHYHQPSTKRLHSPSTMLDIKDITHELVLHCNKFETWIKQRDTFFICVGHHLKKQNDKDVVPEFYQAWKPCMAAANVATNAYLLEIQKFTADLSSRLVSNRILRVLRRERGSRRRSNGRLLQRLESDPLEMSKYLLSFSSRSEIIQIDQEEYSEMLHELNDIRSRYACSAREAIATTKKAIEDLVKKPIKKVERAFTCLQDANPAVPDGADLGFIDKDEPQLPIIAFVQHPWELL